MEEKTPVGSNAPIEESTEKKTSPAGSSSASPAPIEESAGAVDAASTDVSAESTDAGEESAPAGSNSRSWLAKTPYFCARSQAWQIK